ncbi:hypothetical protein ACIGFK_07445 [Streptomyces sp. NPDC085524]|uniref:hypothetical protein n=1 Tax=unclassified Streptomyces TaxID=2593676 RepID=UPI0035DF8D14
MSRPTSLTRRLHAVEQRRDGRRLVHPYRLADGSAVRLSTLDVLAALRDGLALHGTHVTAPPSPVVRSLAALDPADDTSMMGRTVRAVAAEWCAAYAEGRPVALHAQGAAG